MCLVSCVELFGYGSALSRPVFESFGYKEYQVIGRWQVARDLSRMSISRMEGPVEAMLMPTSPKGEVATLSFQASRM